MNLESVEQRCLAFLGETPNPLVPVARLLDELRQDEDCAGVTEAELLGFLRKHELFTVVDPLSLPSDPAELAELEAAGMMTKPRVMLTSRTPTKAELIEALQRNMGTMMNALDAAMNQARGERNPEMAMGVQAVLKRARDMQKKMGDAGLK